MDIWTIVENGHFPHVSTHLTEKGALVFAYQNLLQEYEELMLDTDGSCESLKGQYPETHAFVNSISSLADIGDNPSVTKEDLRNHFQNFRAFIGAWTDWNINCEIWKTKVRA